MCLLSRRIITRLPPCGGSGLKSYGKYVAMSEEESPSMRREWIEITKSNSGSTSSYVSLHAEGVD